LWNKGWDSWSDLRVKHKRTQKFSPKRPKIGKNGKLPKYATHDLAHRKGDTVEPLVAKVVFFGCRGGLFSGVHTTPCGSPPAAEAGRGLRG
jgi:hypothetical protein